MAYEIEIKLASGSFLTPAQSRLPYPEGYGQYARDGITVHWFGDPDKSGTHDETVAYILRQAAAGQMSSNYVASNSKATLIVDPSNVAWHSANGTGNATTIGIEFDPKLNDEGYRLGGWLIAQLEKKYGKTLKLWKHSDWFNTACPGTISLDRLRQEADKAKQAGGTDMSTSEALALADELWWAFVGRKIKQSEVDEYVPLLLAGKYKEVVSKVSTFGETVNYVSRLLPADGKSKQLAAEVQAVLNKYKG